jgi:hypothetical protein
MKKLIIALPLLVLLTGCIFQPPVTVDNSVEVYDETENSPYYTDKSTQDLLLNE